jgi:hemolysin III
MPSAPIDPIPGFNEPFSSLSHWLGTVVFAALGIGLLLRGRGDRLRLAALAVYVASLVFLFSMSAVFHMLPRNTPAGRVFERLDHVASFALIAGTFTPPHVILLRGWARWGPLALVWAAAAAGMMLKTIFFAQIPEWLGTVLYLALGWAGVFGAVKVTFQFGGQFAAPLWGGAAAYSLGAWVQAQGPVLFPGVIAAHEVWHVAVLVAAALHWAFIYQFAGGWDGREPEPDQREAGAVD